MNDAEYEYSGSGETSEDLTQASILDISQQPILPKDPIKIPPTPPPQIIEQRPQYIDLEIALNSQIPSLSFYNDNNYSIEQLQNIPLQNNFISELTDYAIINIAHPLHYSKIPSEYGSTSFEYFAWTNIDETPANEFPSVVHNAIKSSYQLHRKQLRFVHLVSPTKEKIEHLSHNRKEVPNDRLLFHYIGYGYPASKRGSIFIHKSNPSEFVEYPIENLLRIMKTPSFFIFDCDYSGKFIKSVSDGYEKIKKEQKVNSSCDFNDWLCLCATGNEEKIPTDNQLPRDILTSCLLSPIQTSLVSHILQYYRTSFPGPDFPLQYIKHTLTERKFPFDVFDNLFKTIVNSIISDFLEPKLYKRLFRKDKLVASLFRNFILAQYILMQYSIHPQSNPPLPSMAHHPMWLQWQSSLDMWLTSSLSQVASYDSFFYVRSINTFKNMMKNGQDKLIRNSLLTTLCQIPFSDSTAYSQSAMSAIADYVLAKNENREKVAKFIVFSSFFGVILDNAPMRIKDFHSLSCLVLSLLQYDMNFIFHIKKETNFKALLNRLFDPRITNRTKIMIAAILSCFASHFKSLKNALTSSNHFQFLKQIITDPESNSYFIMWLLMLLKKTYETESIDPKLFYESAFHIELVNHVFNNNPSCRAALLSALSCFMQPSDMALNTEILLFCLPTFVDVSFLVRYELLILLVRFLSTHRKVFFSQKQKSLQINVNFSFNELLSNCLNQNFKWPDIERDFRRYATVVNGLVYREDSQKYICELVLFFIDYFSYDPHPTIRSNSIKARAMFDKLISKYTGNDSIPIISPFFGTPIHMINVDVRKNEPSKIMMVTRERKNRQVLKRPNMTGASLSQTNGQSSTNSLYSTPQASSVSIGENIANNSTSSMTSQSTTSQSGNEESYESTAADSNNSTKSALFQNDSDPIFNLFLDEIISSKGQEPPQREMQTIVKTTNFGTVQIPAARLQLRASTYQMKSQATHMALHPMNHESAFSTEKGDVFYFDENMNHYSTVNLFPKNTGSISDLCILDYNHHPYIVASTSCGCIQIWKPGNNYASCSWRTDSNFLCENVSQYAAVAQNHPKIVSVRGNGAIALWDIESQKLVGEWYGMDQYIASKIMYSPSSTDIAIAGYASGSIVGVDLRVASGLKSARIMSFSLSDKLVNFGGNRNGGELIYAASQNGKCMCWNVLSKQLNNCRATQNASIINFDVHQALPLLAIGRANETIVLKSITGEVLYTSRGIASNSIIKFHSILPVITFAQANGEISSYSIELASDAK